MKFRTICIFSLALWLFNSPVFSQIENITITSANIKNGTKRLELRGSWKVRPDKKKDYTIQVALWSQKKEGWQIINSLANIRGNSLWYININQVDEYIDPNEGTEIMAIIVLKEEPLLADVLDQSFIKHNSLAYSASRSLLFKDDEDDPKLEAEPYIIIDQISSVNVKPYSEHPYPVKLEEILSGKVHKKPEHFIQIVVQPLKGPDRWIMNRDLTAPSWNWNCNAYFGRKGWDEFHEFNTYAIITKRPLPTDRAIIPSEWAQYKHTIILAVSPEIYVRRVMPTKLIDIEITAVEGKIVDSKNVWAVGQFCNINGRIINTEKRPIKSIERITIFAISESVEGYKETRLGEASLQDWINWELPPRKLGDLGESLQLIALISEKRINHLVDAETANAVVFSDPIKIFIEDGPPCEIVLQSVDQQVIGIRDSLKIIPISDARGVLNGQLPQQEFKIWLYSIPRSLKGGWRLTAGPAAMTNNTSWVIPPRELGQIGDELILMAVAILGNDASERLTENDSIKIMAISNRILVKLGWK